MIVNITKDSLMSFVKHDFDASKHRILINEVFDGEAALIYVDKADLLRALELLERKI